MKHDPAGLARIRTEGSSLGIELSLAQAEQLLEFETVLRRHAVPLGLVARGDAGRIRERHVLDSLRAAAVVRPEDQDAYDLGSGAGLPGIAIATALPHLRVALVESRRRRAALLERTIENLGLANTTVVRGRIEELELPVDLCFARALAPAARAWAIADRLLRPSGRLVYFAGASFEPADLPAGPIVSVLYPAPSSLLESSGPLVIMARQ